VPASFDSLTTSTTTPPPTTTLESGEEAAIVTRTDLAVSVAVPTAWTDTPGEDQSTGLYRDGDSGFIMLMDGFSTSYGGDAVADKLVGACNGDAELRARVNEVKTQLSVTTIDGHRACLVRPRQGTVPDDRVRAEGPMFVQVEVFVEYLIPLHENEDGSALGGFLLIVDSAHGETIVQTLRLLDGH
jgi:hypothetical protein